MHAPSRAVAEDPAVPHCCREAGALRPPLPTPSHVCIPPIHPPLRVASENPAVPHCRWEACPLGGSHQKRNHAAHIAQRTGKAIQASKWHTQAAVQVSALSDGEGLLQDWILLADRQTGRLGSQGRWGSEQRGGGRAGRGSFRGIAKGRGGGRGRATIRANREGEGEGEGDHQSQQGGPVLGSCPLPSPACTPLLPDSSPSTLSIHTSLSCRIWF